MSFLSKYSQDFRLNFKLALPIIAGQLGQITVYIVDNIMVGRLGADSLAAVSLAVAIIAVPTVVGMGISFALPPLVSEAEGAEQPKKISQYFKHSLVVNLLIGVITCGLIMLGLPLISSLGQEPAVAELATDYIWFSALAMIPMMFFFTFRSYADGMSETLPPMIAMIAGNVFDGKTSGTTSANAISPSMISISSRRYSTSAYRPHYRCSSRSQHSLELP